MSTNDKPWYANGASVAWLIVGSVVACLGFPYLKAIFPNPQREKVVTLWNNYIECKKQLAALRKSVPAEPDKQTKQTAREFFTKGIAIVDRLDPYDPIGGDPAMASAVKDYKTVFNEFSSAIISELDHNVDTESQAHLEWEKRMGSRIRSAEDNIQKEYNRIASEVGGIYNRRSSSTD
jgi:hypothetical protein